LVGHHLSVSLTQPNNFFFVEIVVVVLDDIKELSEMQQEGHEGGPKVEAYSLEVFFFPPLFFLETNFCIIALI